MDSNSPQSLWLATLIHYSDGVLPVGAYAHSFGLEGMIQLGVVTDAGSLEKFLLQDVTEVLKSVDLPLVAHAWRASQCRDLAHLIELDSLSKALRPVRQLQEATSKIGKQQWKIFKETWGASNEELTQFQWKHHQSPVVLGMILERENAPIEAALWSYAYQTYSAQLQAALKLLPIGPRMNQQLLHRALQHCQPAIEAALNTAVDDIGSANPTWDLAASSHAHAQARMFIS
ncbi:urease accessory protein UreF [Rubritalea marina]|uniref:urease accessory protein UreF n=1 Tax=Rubritalea marina TaxID=361055 RepID=UPI00037EE4C4|nr:urease accessory UreF family protein [Rubritalea marina]